MDGGMEVMEAFVAKMAGVQLQKLLILNRE